MTGHWTNLGRMPYAACTELQRRVMAGVIAGVLPNTLLFVEHSPPVFSLGAGFHPENLLLPVEEYLNLGYDVEPTERGGDVTFHGPNQLVAYPIFHLDLVGKDLHRWLRELEETVIVALHELGLKGYRFSPNTGIWVNGAKVCAIGVKVRKWVSMHGIALNVCNDLSPFDLIVPCGIRGYGVTSIQRECGQQIGAFSPGGFRLRNLTGEGDPEGIIESSQGLSSSLGQQQDPEGIIESSQGLSEATRLYGGYLLGADPAGIIESSQGLSEATPLVRVHPNFPTPEGSKKHAPTLAEARSAVTEAFSRVFNLSLQEQHREDLFARLSERGL